MSKATFLELLRRRFARDTTLCAPDLPEHARVRILPRPAFDWADDPILGDDDCA